MVRFGAWRFVRLSVARHHLLRRSRVLSSACAKAAPVGRGHEHPHGKKNRLRSGHDVGEARICEFQSFPGTAGCSWPTFTGGLWHFWGSGFGGSSVNAAESAPRLPASLPNGIASLQGPSAGTSGRVAVRPISPRHPGAGGQIPARATAGRLGRACDLAHCAGQTLRYYRTVGASEPAAISHRVASADPSRQ